LFSFFDSLPFLTGQDGIARRIGAVLNRHRWKRGGDGCKGTIHSGLWDSPVFSSFIESSLLFLESGGLVQNTPDNGSGLSGTFPGASVKPCLQHKPVIPYCMVHYKFCKDNKNQQIPISRVTITRPCYFSPLWGTQEQRTGS
jgi:hypothetical protein